VGSARQSQEAREHAAKVLRELEVEQKRRILERKRAAHKEQLAKLQVEHESEVFELERAISAEEIAEGQLTKNKADMARLRWADDNS
jgi:hypothetical protein